MDWSVLNPFENSLYWLGKGFKAQTGLDGNKAAKPEQFYKLTLDRADQAIDYYLQGLRVNPRDFACCYNVALCFLLKNYICNAMKWFKLSIVIEPHSPEAFLGLAVTKLKLSKHHEAI